MNLAHLTEASPPDIIITPEATQVQVITDGTPEGTYFRDKHGKLFLVEGCTAVSWHRDLDSSATTLHLTVIGSEVYFPGSEIRHQDLQRKGLIDVKYDAILLEDLSRLQPSIDASHAALREAMDVGRDR